MYSFSSNGQVVLLRVEEILDVTLATDSHDSRHIFRQ